MTILRVTCFVNWANEGILEIVETRANGAPQNHASRFRFLDAEQVLEAAEKMRLIGLDMQREAEAREAALRG